MKAQFTLVASPSSSHRSITGCLNSGWLLRAPFLKFFSTLNESFRLQTQTDWYRKSKSCIERLELNFDILTCSIPLSILNDKDFGLFKLIKLARAQTCSGRHLPQIVSLLQPNLPPPAQQHGGIKEGQSKWSLLWLACAILGSTDSFLLDHFLILWKAVAEN